MTRLLIAPRLSLIACTLAGLCLAAAGPTRAQGSLRDTLVEPPVLVDHAPEEGRVVVDLVAAPARLEMRPGTETDAYAYNGTVPGPTLKVREGDRVVVRFENRLAEPTTIHWHGLHLPFHADGSPFDPVQPGETYEYRFTIPEGTAGTYWYHPHPDGRTTRQLGMGLFGAVVVRAADDPLPAMTEHLLILWDSRFRSDGSFDFPEPGTREARIDAENGREGDVILVNGRVLPEIPIRSGEIQRWRVVNASGARVYRLSLSGHSFLHVGTDGGLFERPEEVDEILLANTERVELLVRGTDEPGGEVVLQSLPYDRYRPLTRPDDWDEPLDLLRLAYTDEAPVEPVDLPRRLRPVTPLDPSDAVATRVLRLSQNRINGEKMEMSRVDATAELDTTEIWEIRNLVGMDHPFHLHGFRFQVLSRDGVPVRFRRWKDTVNVPKRETVRFIVRFEDYPGKWMFHCHIVNHEDQGMMGILEVTE